MPQFISIILAVLFGFKDLFKGKEGKDGKTDNTLKNIIIGVVVYFLVNRFLNQQVKADLLENAANDPSTGFAIRLKDAMNPTGVDWLNSVFGDGTNETEINLIGSEMSVSKNFRGVSDAYKKIYGSDLSEDLRKEGVYDVFIAAYNKTTIGNGGTGSGNIGGGSNNQNSGFKVGEKIYFKASNWNVRSNVYPFLPIFLSKKDQNAGYVVNKNFVKLTAKNKNGTFSTDTFLLLTDKVSNENYYASMQVLRR